MGDHNGAPGGVSCLRGALPLRAIALGTIVLGAASQAITGVGATARCWSAEPSMVIDVFPGPAPGASANVGAESILPARPNENPPVKRITNVSHPTISVFPARPDRATGAGVLICPGGAYNILAFDKEGEEVAAWLSAIGINGFVLKYRVPAREGLARHELPMKDAQRALRVIRSRANEWKLDPKRLGMLGFSAGGHLTALTATNYDRPSYEPIDSTDHVSSRPDFAVLVYPWELAEKDDVTRLQSEFRVTKDSPPTFLAHAGDDRVGAENSIAFYLALKRANVPAELHVYARGGHGFGLRDTGTPASTWPARCEDWLKSQGIIQ